MKTFYIMRLPSTEYGTFGVLVYERIPFAVTLEPPWNDNQRDDPNTPEDESSCVLAGVYILKRVNSPAYGNVFTLTDVQGRTYILLHWGNVRKNTKGCVLIAEEFGNLAGVPAVLNSKNTAGKGFNEFMNLLEGEDEARLIIQWMPEYQEAA